MDAGKASKDHRYLNFSFTLQNFTTLYLTAIKCRNPNLRRRALSLLKTSPKREGFWDSSLVIKMVERVIEVEEEGLEDLTDLTGSGVPSEWSRIHDISVIPELGQKTPGRLFQFRRLINGQWQHIQERFTGWWRGEPLLHNWIPYASNLLGGFVCFGHLRSGLVYVLKSSLLPKYCLSSRGTLFQLETPKNTISGSTDSEILTFRVY